MNRPNHHLQQVIRTAEQAAADALNRYLDEQSEAATIAEQKEQGYCTLLLTEKTYKVFMNYDHYFFEGFGRHNRPEAANCILELSPVTDEGEVWYRITTLPGATARLIQQELNELILPF